MGDEDISIEVPDGSRDVTRDFTYEITTIAEVLSSVQLPVPIEHAAVFYVEDEHVYRFAFQVDTREGVEAMTFVSDVDGENITVDDGMKSVESFDDLMYDVRMKAKHVVETLWEEHVIDNGESTE